MTSSRAVSNLLSALDADILSKLLDNLQPSHSLLSLHRIPPTERHMLVPFSFPVTVYFISHCSLTRSLGYASYHLAFITSFMLDTI